MPRPRTCLILLGLLVLSCGLDASGTFSFARVSVPSMFDPQVSSQFDDNYLRYPYFLYYDVPLKAPKSGAAFVTGRSMSMPSISQSSLCPPAIRLSTVAWFSPLRNLP